MADIQKPDMSKQWANSGDKTPPSDALINAGWAVGSIPSNSDFNYIDARQDQGLAYILQKGVPEWDASTEYQANKSFAQYNGVLYKAIQTGVNKQPDTQAAYWKSLFDVKQNATGSVAYDLASFASQWVFPQMFSTLQAAIDYADSSNKVLAFPAGTYTYTNAPNFAKSNLVLMALGEVVFHHTGTGSAFVLDAGPSGGVYNLQMIGDFCVKGNANTDTSAGVYIRAVHHSHIKIRAYDMPATAFYVAFGVLTHYDLTCSVNQQAFTITPTTGVVFNRRNTGEYVADCTMRLVMEGINGLGVDFQDVQGCRVEGTTEGNVYGFRDSSTCADNTFIGVWCEANTTRDYELHGQRNTFINCKSISAVSGVNCEVVTAVGTSFVGGFWRHVNLQAGSSNTKFDGVSVSDNASLGIKGSGSYKTINTYKVDINGVKTGVVKDRVGDSGTWTPVLSSSGGTYNHVYDVQEGSYYDIGGVRYFQARLTILTKDVGMSGNVYITGLDSVATGSFSSGLVGVHGNIAPDGTRTQLGWYISPASSSIVLSNVGFGVADTLVSSSQIANGTRIFISGSYLIG